MSVEAKHEVYCAKCGKTVNGNNGWRCVGCRSWFCVSCKHSEYECVKRHDEGLDLAALAQEAPRE
jgi:hypothetical protein